ncbi:FAD-dependent monooxygenase [Xanthobacter dioxanivorans]|uniref:FAD-dependent monooxygenase n=1 Tax=Xanthobacter dioxanivorans TaxID=2528964 RepID=A0A974SJ97_9HYPH|nr:FAD-dependent monooxygenase [Xanthobacter dioxanivorans]QRG07014.1 FAD-dependent monooxygenase [Xanthobacter dioxanivorans]
MHTPETQPRASVFYTYKIYPFRRPEELVGGAARAPVVIVGAGPVGLLTAIDLARYGVRSVVLEAEQQVSHGSRAIVLTRRSMEILQHAGVAEPFVRKGLQWSKGRSFFRGKEVYQMVMPHDSNDRFLPGLNISQQYIEEYLVDAAERTGLVDLRWGSKVTDIHQNADAVLLSIDTPEGEYALTADYVVAADGGRSTVRRLLGLRMEGRAYAGNFVIADIKANIDLPTERLCFFDPDWNPGNNVLVHRQPDDIWRLDFRLPDGETAEEALERSRLAARIDLILAMIGRKVPWELDWATVYSASTLTLPDYVSGRVAFVGDAAHLLPIFGVRGANTGFQDAGNLSWKLALVAKGLAPPRLLESYSQERVTAAREICDEAAKSTRFMSPPTPGYRLMRDAVLSLSLSQDFCRNLLHWRTSRPHVYAHSALNSPSADAFITGPAPGEPALNARIAEGDHLQDHFGPGFQLLCFPATPADVAPLAAAMHASGLPVTVLALGRGAAEGADVVLPDPDGVVAARYGAAPGTAYLLRPDLHVCARWRAPTPEGVTAALTTAIAGERP